MPGDDGAQSSGAAAVNTNEATKELATMGGLAYVPSEDTTANLVGRTRRAHTTRQSAVTNAARERWRSVLARHRPAALPRPAAPAD